MQNTFQEAGLIPALTHAEAGVMAKTELERFLALVESLSGDDWDKPTACTLWNVRQILAHQAGAYAGFARWAQFKRQWLRPPTPAPGQLQLDAVNQRQVEDRAHASPASLLVELREVGPKAVATRQRLPALLRVLYFPIPSLGFVRLDYLTDLIYIRDTWSHRLDICRATGREMIQTTGHDGRIVALVIRELAGKLTPILQGASIVYELSGLAGGSWRIGRAVTPGAIIQVDALDFNLLASGRLTPHEAKAQSLLSTRGDPALVDRVLDHTRVPY